MADMFGLNLIYLLIACKHINVFKAHPWHGAFFLLSVGAILLPYGTAYWSGVKQCKNQASAEKPSKIASDISKETSHVL